jgi:hypothetical protein
MGVAVRLDGSRIAYVAVGFYDELHDDTSADFSLARGF